MTSLATRVEVIKLSVALSVEPDSLAHLRTLTAEDVRALRESLEEALFVRHEARFRRIAKLASTVPVPLAARVAQMALDPFLGARVAAVMEPATAVKLAGNLDTDYLADLSVSLDPVRARGIIAGIPAVTVVKVGAKLVEQQEHLALGRFVSVIDPDTALEVVEHATGADLLQVALFAEDATALDAMVSRLDDARLLQAIEAADEKGWYDDAVTLVSSVTEASRNRLVPLIADLAPSGRDGFALSIHAHDAWALVIPSLATLEDASLAAIANTEATLDPGMLDRIVAVAREQSREELLERLQPLLDSAHQKALQEVLTSS